MQPLATGNEHILLVDDEAMIIEMETLMLETLGYRVSAQCSSVEALAIFRQQRESIDLVITDLTMPQMTGDRLAKEIHALDPTVPIIICSGFSEMLGREQLTAIGVKEVMMKPITIAELAQTIRGVLDAASAGRCPRHSPTD